MALVRASKALTSVLQELQRDERTGTVIIQHALEEPLKLIIENAGEEPAVVLDSVKRQQDDYGFDAEKMEYGPMLEFGIIDPGQGDPLGAGERRQRCGH